MYQLSVSVQTFQLNRHFTFICDVIIIEAVSLVGTCAVEFSNCMLLQFSIFLFRHVELQPRYTMCISSLGATRGPNSQGCSHHKQGRAWVINTHSHYLTGFAWRSDTQAPVGFFEFQSAGIFVLIFQFDFYVFP